VQGIVEAYHGALRAYARKDGGRRETACLLCEGSDMPDAERTKTAAPPLRRPRGRRVPAQLLERPSRKQQAERIEALAGRGLGSEEIAARLGLSRSTVNKYRRDPEGERACLPRGLPRPLPRLRAPHAGE